MEQGSQEALKHRSVGKFDRLSRRELHIKERKDKERSLSDERAKIKQKQEKKSEHQADDSQQKEGVKLSTEEKCEKKSKIKSEKKMTGNTREGKMSVSEGVADDGPKDAKKVKTQSTEAAKSEKDKEKEKDKIREKDKDKGKEKSKGEKMSAKSDFKQLLRPDSAGSSEDRSDMEPGSDSSKKKDKHFKEVLKRSKSHSEDRQGEKSKSKMDSKDGEKEKIKVDQETQKSKSISETDKDLKRVKPTEKGRTVEKTKSKSKEETKTHLFSKADKKVQSSEVKSSSGASICRPETTKEKKKDGTAKEYRKASEEPSHDKSENKSAKKKLDKKDKVPEKKDDHQDEKKTPREEKLEKPDKSSKSSVSSLSLDTEEPTKKQPLLQELSTDSDPITTTVTTSFSDDTCDALSDITPEPPEGETESRLGEMPAVPAVPAEADALLTLMDVCTSAEARLPTESIRGDVTVEMELQEADMKMKEAALTLLSMDPDSTVSSSLIRQDSRDGLEVNSASPQPSDAEKEEQTAAESEFTTTWASPSAPQQNTEPVEGITNTAGT